MSRVRRPRPLTGDALRRRIEAYRMAEGAAAVPALENLVRRACEATGVAAAWLSLHDEGRERMLAASGVERRALAAEESFALAPSTQLPLFVEDAQHSGLQSHPLVRRANGARFVAVVPLATPDGLVVGSLTLVDRVPRKLSPHARSAVDNLALLCVARLEARREDLVGQVSSVASGGGLALEKDLSAAVIDSYPGAFWLTSSDGTIVRWNRQLAVVSGYSDAEIGSMHPLDFISDRDRAAVDAAKIGRAHV